MPLSLVKNAEIQRVMNAVAAGTSTQTSSTVDAINCESVTFIASFGTITTGSVTSMKIQGSDDDSSYSDIAGSACAVLDSDDNKQAVIEIVRGTHRYYQAVIVRSTQNVVIDNVVAIKRGLRKAPATQPSSVANSVVLISPVAGTA